MGTTPPITTNNPQNTRSTKPDQANPETGELLDEGSPTGIIANISTRAAANLPWFLNHSPERLFEIAHIESTKEVRQALFGMPRIPFA